MNESQRNVLEEILRTYVLNRAAYARISDRNFNGQFINFSLCLPAIPGIALHYSGSGIDQEDDRMFAARIAAIEKQNKGYYDFLSQATDILEHINTIEIHSLDQETAEQNYAMLVGAFERLNALGFAGAEITHSVNMATLYNCIQRLMELAKSETVLHPEAESVVGNLQRVVSGFVYFGINAENVPDENNAGLVYHLKLPSDILALDRVGYLPDSIYDKVIEHGAVLARKPLSTRVPVSSGKRKKSDQDSLMIAIGKYAGLGEEEARRCYNILDKLRYSGSREQLTREELADIILVMPELPERTGDALLKVVPPILIAYRNVRRERKSTAGLREVIEKFKQRYDHDDVFRMVEKICKHIANIGTNIEVLV